MEHQMGNNNDPSRLTLRSFLSQAHPGVDRIDYVRDSELKGGLGKDPNTDKELLDFADTEGLLGDYLKYITDHAGSIYGISSGIDKAESTDRGSEIPTSAQGSAKRFLPPGENDQRWQNFSQDSRSDYFENLENIIDKTAANDGTDLPEGHMHTLLSGSPREELTDGVEGVLKINRFSNATDREGFAQNITSPESFEDVQMTAVSSQQGELSYKKTLGSSTYKAGEGVDMASLKRIGASMLLKASGFQPKNLTRKFDDVKKDIDEASGAHQQYSSNEFSKIGMGRLQARFAEGFPVYPGRPASEDDGNIMPRFGSSNEEPSSNTGTFGQNYNTEVHMTKKGQDMLKVRAAIACKLLKTLADDFFNTVKSYLNSKEEGFIKENESDMLAEFRKYEGPGPHILGTYKQLTSNKLDILLKRVFVRTTYPYGECYDKGVAIFFGVNNNLQNIQQTISDSPGYWLAIASSIIKSIDSIEKQFDLVYDSGRSTTTNGKEVEQLLDLVMSNKFLHFANVAATVGDIHFRSNMGRKNGTRQENDKFNPFNVDALPTTPATRVGKSRDAAAETPFALAWRQNSVPSMYLLTNNVIKAALKLDNTVIGTNPVRGMLGSSLVKNTYFGASVTGNKNLLGSGARIPNDVAKRLEDRLDAEYVPFYIQDLRTNEIISFHAFLSSLSDNIQPNFNAVSGYGRLDDVQIYNTTKRTINVGFTLYATSKEDFNDMWYKINKFVTLMYPQWTKGTLVSQTGFDSFTQPFSQVIGATPIVRLRIGDVIKSNYSRFNLARVFGIGDDDVAPVPDDSTTLGDLATSAVSKLTKASKATVQRNFDKYQDVLLEIFRGVFGSPIQLIPSKVNAGAATRYANLGLAVARNAVSSFLINGFVNPLGAGYILRRLTDPEKLEVVPKLNADSSNLVGLGKDANVGTFNMTSGENVGYVAKIGHRMLLKHNMTRGYVLKDSKQKIYLDRPILVKVTGKQSKVQLEGAYQTSDFKGVQTFYTATIIDHNVKSGLLGQDIFVHHADLLPEPSDLFNYSAGLLFMAASPTSILDLLLDQVTQHAQSTGLGKESIDLVRSLYQSDASRFMDADVNPFVRAYESTSGRGLAGVVKGVNFNWLDNNIPWETDYNSRAPIGCEISFSFDVIHDIPPGLDHAGYNRAPLYNVGDVMKHVTGDAHDDHEAAEFRYKLAGLGTMKKTGGD